MYRFDRRNRAHRVVRLVSGCAEAPQPPVAKVISACFGGKRMIATFGYAAVSYAVSGSIILSLGMTVWGFRRSWSWMLLTAGALSLFFCVAEAPSIGLFVLPLPFLQSAFGIGYLIRGQAAIRVAVGVVGGLMFVLLGTRLIALALF